MKNFMSLEIDAVSKNEAFARSVVGAFCVELNPTLEQINDIKTAVSEAVTNCIVHGYGEKDGKIKITATIIDYTVHIEIVDSGVGIPDINMAMQPFFTTKPDDERSGMGFTVMESFMDTLQISIPKDGGCKVVMSKNLNVNNDNVGVSNC